MSSTEEGILRISLYASLPSYGMILLLDDQGKSVRFIFNFLHME